ncbi:hypothetical protein C1H46_030850 [Malus baccata]|uniref:Uncharacterized protein n=1 Tax=Malus baccata TaxID=106549 RepID=A0A540LBG9_MALBA|nr:hypothetical protein C1H46_030850 [Malus baccata]
MPADEESTVLVGLPNTGLPVPALHQNGHCYSISYTTFMAARVMWTPGLHVDLMFKCFFGLNACCFHDYQS